jgi:hypothetical protein
MGIKMVLSGEGADEIFGGYLYFHRAPGRALVPRGDGPQAGPAAPLRLPARQQGDGRVGRRGARAVPRQGVPRRRHAPRPGREDGGPGRMEKQILREAFADVLPPSVAWRQKEQFSDGVGYGWIDSLRAHAEAQVSDRELANARYRFPHNPPATKEAYLYRASSRSTSRSTPARSACRAGRRSRAARRRRSPGTRARRRDRPVRPRREFPAPGGHRPMRAREVVEVAQEAAEDAVVEHAPTPEGQGHAAPEVQHPASAQKGAASPARGARTPGRCGRSSWPAAPATRTP